ARSSDRVELCWSADIGRAPSTRVHWPSTGTSSLCARRQYSIFAKGVRAGQAGTGGREDEPEHLTTRDKSFLRALINNDYKLSQLDILRYELDFINAYPDRMPCLVFDYSGGPLNFRFLSEHGLNDHVHSELEDDPLAFKQRHFGGGDEEVGRGTR
ncbi:hypothetical protein B0H16DRAFT_1485383, partial [Mycena metata]